MNEEEIIRNVKRIIEYKVISNYINDNDSRAIQCLLDLYQKEKQKNERLIDRTIKYDNTLEHLQRDTIRKDKIKEVADDYESKGYIEIAGAMRELLEERN